MPEPTLSELKDSIEELLAYRERLHTEVTSVAKKLRMPQKKIESSLKKHPELSMLNDAISKLREELESRELN